MGHSAVLSDIYSADTTTQRSGFGKQVRFPVRVRSSDYLNFGCLRLPVFVDTAMTIEEAYSQLIMPGSYPPPNRDDGRVSSWSYINPSQPSQATTQHVGDSSAASFASSQHGTSSTGPYHAGSLLDDRPTTLWADPLPLVLEPPLPVPNMTLSDPFRPSTSYASDRNQQLLSTFQSSLSGKDTYSTGNACSSNNVPIMAATYHQDQSAIISQNQVGLRDKVSDPPPMASDEVQVVEIPYLSLPALQQYLYAMKHLSKLPGPDELYKQLRQPQTRKNLVKNMKLLVFHNFVRECNGLEPTTEGICRTCLAQHGVFCVPHGEIPGQGCFCPRKRTRGKKLRLDTGTQT
jgi:hypothetical protein